MGKVRKQAPPHSDITLSPALRRFIDAAVKLPLHELPPHLGTFPAHWPFPRGDLFNWIPVLDRFDEILEKFTRAYNLHEGPQAEAFGRKLLLEKSEKGEAVGDDFLDRAGYSREGDRELIEHILDFSCLLFENCANRRLYASSQHLDAILNTTSLSLLNSSLKLALKLAQKYASDRTRQSGHPREGNFLTSISHSTLATHYQISLDKIQKLALPFRHGLASPAKRSSDIKQTDQGLNVAPSYASDLLAILYQDDLSKNLEAFGQPYFSLKVDGKGSNGEEPSVTTNGEPSSRNDHTSARFDLIEVPTSELRAKPLHEIVAQYMPKFPKQCQYEFLCRLRVSFALCGSRDDRAAIVQTRLCAIGNYLNIFPESQHHLQQKIFQIEGEDVRPGRLSTQLCNLLHPPPGNAVPVPRQLQTLALAVFEGFTIHHKKSAEAITALGANVNHGVLAFIVRKAVNELSADTDDARVEERDWYKALFNLLLSFPKSVPRAADGLVSTGIFRSFVDALRLRGSRAESSFASVLNFLDVFLYNVANTYTALSEAGGLEVIADLLRYEVDQSFTTALNGQGVPSDWKSGVVDYGVGFLQQSTLRNLLKLLKNMITVNSGGLDRTLRNLIESAQLLSGLRYIIDFPSVFGSNVWSGAVEMFSNFIHNEPTSYSAIAEAGLTNAFLSTVTGAADSKTLPPEVPDGASAASVIAKTQSPPPTLEAVSAVPFAFSAICLNENGMRQFTQSDALGLFFSHTLKPEVIDALASALQDHRSRQLDVESLGAAFDELARHHPSLKPEIVRKFAELLGAVHEDVTDPRHQQSIKMPGAKQPPADLNESSVLKPLCAPRKDTGDVEMRDADEASVDQVAKQFASMNRLKVVFEMLSGFFTNTAFYALFAEHGGIEKLVDVVSAPVYPIQTPSAISSPGVSKVMSTFIVQKPHLVVPLLLDRLDEAVNLCTPFLQAQNETMFFSATNGDSSEHSGSLGHKNASLNALSIIRNIISILTPTFLEPGSRNSPNPITSINVSDILMKIVPKMVSVTRSCILENALLQNQAPARYADKPQKTGSALDAAQSSEAKPSDATQGSAQTSDQQANTNAVHGDSAVGELSAVEEQEKQNFFTIGGLVKNLPSEISFFVHTVGKSLALSRRLPSDSYLRSKYLALADVIAKSLVDLLQPSLPTSFSTKIADYTRRNLVAACVAALIDKHSDPASQFLTIIIWQFKKAGGIGQLVELAQKFFTNTQLSGHEGASANIDEATWAFQGLRAIFSFFMRATSLRAVHESHQTSVLTSRAKPARDGPDTFSEGQFLVELRHSALEIVRPIWDSDAISKFSQDLMKQVCTILQYSLEGNNELGAFKRSDKIPNRNASPSRKWRLRDDSPISALTSRGVDRQLAQEALYRCQGHPTPAQEYCDNRIRSAGLPRFPIPSDDIDQSSTTMQDETPAAAAEDAHEPDVDQQAGDEDTTDMQAEAREIASRLLESGQGASPFDTAIADHIESSRDRARSSGRKSANDTGATEVDKPAEETSVVTADTLDEVRNDVRNTLVDRSLYILDSFQSLSFELADLITSSCSNISGDRTESKADISRTLLHSLLSYQGGDDVEQLTGKVASCAHLLAVIFQDSEFFASARGDLKDNVEALTQYLTPPRDTQELTWMSNILLIVEKMICEDFQPQTVEPSASDSADGSHASPLVRYKDPLIPKEGRQELFTALTNLFPRVGKDSALGVSSLRVMIALTRDPAIAGRLTDKKNMQRLFVMVKQLAVVPDTKIMPLLMVVLRQVVEDEATIRQAMRDEIEHYITKNARRSPSVQEYLRQLFGLSLRSPQLFVEVTNELLALSRSHGEQSLVMKRDLPPIGPSDESNESKTATEEGAPPESSVAVTADPAKPQPSTEQTHAKTETQTIELRAPLLPRIDGVSTFLLSELMAYKDVQDRESTAPSSNEKPADSQGDVEMGDGEARQHANPAAATSDHASDSKPEKPSFKLEEHSIFVYRCLLMQCLTETLKSYNIAKLNFLSYSRKAEPVVHGTIKPRSGVLNYLLHDLIGDTPFSEAQDMTAKKRGATSNWGSNVLAALCAQTPDTLPTRHGGSFDLDEEQELAFVRRFVLEHALKAYKDASTLPNNSEGKYAKLFNLADLFNRMLSGKVIANPTSPDSPREQRPSTSHSVAKVMFEKHFIPVLTSSVSDLDQHTADATKALRCILKTLKVLTQAAIALSERGKLSSTSDQDEEDEIASASSSSDVAEGREETPDLFRNSTLGMFEPGREDQSSSDDSEDEQGDEDMYGDDYADDMEFDEEDDEQAGDDVVSEEDEEDDPDEMGNVEGLPGDVPIEVELDIEDGDQDDNTDDDDDEEETDPDEMTDDDAEVEIMEEIEGDEDGESDDEQDDEAEEWQDEDEPIDFSADPGPPPGIDPMPGSGDDSNSEAGDLDMPINDPMVDIMQEGDEDPEEQYEVEHIHEDDDDHDSDDEDREIEDEEDGDGFDEMVFGRHEEEEDDWLPTSMPWQMPGGARRGHHHAHHHHRHIPSFMPDVDSMFMPELRSQRAGDPRTPDDTRGVNPLLSRNRREQIQQQSWPRPGRRFPSATNAASFIASLGQNFPDSANLDRTALQRILETLSHGGGFSIQMSGTDAHGHTFRGLPQIFREGPPRPPTQNVEREDPYLAVVFEPSITRTRWEEAARILFSPEFTQKSTDLSNYIVKILTPAANERDRIIKAKQEEQQRKLEEEQARLKAEKEAREAQEKKDREEREAREAAEREAAEAESARLAAETADTTQQQTQADNDTVEAGVESMEGVESTEQAETSQQAAAPQPTEPVMTSIRGREVDISHLGIDTAYLEALPEELREEVIMQQVAEQRSTQTTSNQSQEPSTIDRDFLDALPPDIRAEILAQEAQDQRRRQREEERQRLRDEGAPAQPEEMDPATLIASLDPMLRQQILAEGDEDMLNALPPDLQAEARALGGHRRRGAIPPAMFTAGGGLGLGRVAPSGRELGQPVRIETEKRQRTPIVQMMDKAGVAGLLRLMFVSLHPSPRGALNAVLLNVCANRQTRGEVINGLLLILQDGCSDMNAVERCFSQLTLKAKQQSIPKTPQKKTPPPQTPSAVSPATVVDQSLTALQLLASTITHIPHFFVTEHDVFAGAKSKGGRKGKAKDTKASRYPFMVLVALLDREAVYNNSSNLDLLSALLAQITQTLNQISKKDNKTKSDGNDEASTTQAVSDEQSGQQRDTTYSAADNNTTNGTTSAAEQETSEASHAEAGPTDSNENANATRDANMQDRDQAEASAAASKPDEPSKDTKKGRSLSVPDVPAELLKPVVNLIMSRECNSKIFQSAIATMTSLAIIPGARDVFKHELIEQARTLAQSIQGRLAALREPLRKAETEIDAQSLALAELSPTGSDQSKFHRILTALDYLFQKSKEGEKAQNNGIEKDELIELYEESSFMAIWNRLSEVLNAIKRSDVYFFNVATILLSLIESLMLVCKRISLTEASLSRRQTGQDSEPKIMSQVFFSFTNQHRKILNELVRHNPKLMSNNFSVLIKNPGVLEFDNKRQYFSRKLHHRPGDMRHYPHPSLQLHVRRDQVFLDSYKNLHFKSPEEMKYGKFNIRFHNEEGVDAGGVTREWFQVLARQMFNADYALFNPVASDRTTFHPNPLSWINPEHLSFYKFIGRIIGKALYENRVLDCHFSRAVYKKILGQAVSIKDMETVDLDYSKNMQWMLENDITDIITETFSTVVDKFGVEEVYDLIPGGRDIPVTEENKEEYVRKVIEFRLTGSVAEQMESFLQGFHDIVPKELVSIFDEGELELLISGMPDVDVEDWRGHTDYHTYNASSPQIQWFWRAVRSFDKEERARLLQFVTGTGKVPLNGFKELEGMNGFTRFNIHKDFGSHDRLPSSHTCFNQLDLPEYDSYEALRKGLYTAMTTGNEHFGFA